MNKYAIIALLAIVLIACAPVMPARNETITEETPEETPTNETVEQTPAPEENATMEETPEPEPQVDLRDVPRKEVVEGDLVSFPNLRAVDPDGDPITYTFTTPLNENGEWQTQEGDLGEHLVTITASDGTNTVAQQVLIVVLSKNKAPTIELTEPVEAKEGETLVLQPTITDPEGDTLNITYSGWMDSNTKEIGYDDAGNHKIVITASDGKSTTTREVIVSVANTNRAPELAEIAPETIKEGQKVRINPSARDPDGDTVTFTYDFPLDESGAWQTEVGDAGEYEVLVTASDGTATAEVIFVVTVEAINRAPVIELASPVLVKEGDIAELNPTITDQEGDEVRVTYSGWMNSNTRQTTYDDAGNHKVTITARDSAGNEATLEVIVSVEDVNRPPIFGAGSFN
jgi:hypothetical protein